MNEFDSTLSGEVSAVPGQVRALFNNPDDVQVQSLPCSLPGVTSMAVHFGAGSRTFPHVHHGGQQLVYVDGIGVVGDESGVHLVRAGDVVSSPPNGWHWHGAVPDKPATHVTFELDGDCDRDVDRRDWDDSYSVDLSE